MLIFNGTFLIKKPFDLQKMQKIIFEAWVICRKSKKKSVK